MAKVRFLVVAVEEGATGVKRRMWWEVYVSQRCEDQVQA
jgi:hypothetical protein